MKFRPLALPIWLTISLSSGLLAGCSNPTIHHGYMAKPGAFNRISHGMNKEQVEQILGSPSTTASIITQGDSYYYISSDRRDRSFLGSEEVNREVIAIRFNKANKVESFAQYGLEDGRIININTKKTVMPGADSGVLGDIFGGLTRSKFTPKVIP